MLPCGRLLPGQEGAGWEEGGRRGTVLLSYEPAAPFGPGPGLGDWNREKTEVSRVQRQRSSNDFE